MAIASVNPTTGETLEVFEETTDAQVEDRLARSVAAFAAWRRTPVTRRARVLARAARLLESESEKLARTMTLEMGKPLRAAGDEARKCALACRHYAENAERLTADHAVRTDAAKAFLRTDPLGPVLAIMPWNFPLWQVFRFAAPALLAGNTVLLKHAANVTRCALAIQDLLRRAGLPEDAFLVLLLENDRTERVLADHRVAAATLTGSDAAGSAVGAVAGRHVKKVVLELGGNDAFLVMPSADLDAAVSAAVRARTMNNGQSCIAAKRFVVHEHVLSAFEKAFVDGMRALVVGDPMDARTDVGPLARPDLLERLDRQVRASVAAGARVLLGGERLDRPGNFYPPTVLADVPEESPAAREELFGPVAALFPVADLDEAIRVANDSVYGLGASVWTRNLRERDRFIDALDVGTVFVNGMVASDPRVPFGGVKRSGYGRELGDAGIREFVNLKTVQVAEWPAARGASKRRGGGVRGKRSKARRRPD